MSDVAIRVEKLSKRYRIGLQEEVHDTLAATMTSWLKQPGKNLRRLQQLSRFSENGNEQDDILWALKDVSFEVKRGEVVGVIGRNGAGKSTLLKILSRITHPTSGRVELHGRVSSLLEVGTGFHPELTGRENVYLNGTILGMRKAEIDRKFDEIVDFSGVEKFIDTPVKRYSSGMRVRLAFSVAAYLEPEILLIDEVLAVGDIGFQKKCLGKMDDVAGQGKTILFVSHNMGVIVNLCPIAQYFDQGKLVKIGPCVDIVREYLSNLESHEGSVELLNGTFNRSGEGPMRVTRAATLSADGQIFSRFRYGQSIIFKFTVSSDREMECIVGLSIRDVNDNVILHLTNTDDAENVKVRKGETSVLVRLERIILNDGTYYLTIWLGSSLNRLNDRIENCLQFDVISREAGFVRSLGMVRQSAKWLVH